MTLAVAPGVFPTRAIVVVVVVDDDDDDDDDEVNANVALVVVVEDDNVFNNELLPTLDRPIKAISGTP